MKTLVLGASSNPERYSNKAVFSLLQHGHQVEAIGNKLTGTPFEFQYSVVYHFYSEKNVVYNQIYSCQNSLIEKAKEKGFDIVLADNKIDARTILEICKYYLPYINFNIQNIFISPLLSQLLRLIGYDHKTENAFVYSLDNELHISFIDDSFDSKLLDEFIAKLPYLGDHHLYCQPNFDELDNDDIENLTLDEETRKLINDVFHKLGQLNQSGQFLAILPFIESKISQFKVSNDIPLSELFIDENHRIYLKDYQNREVKLSHLTKSLYFLFLMKGYLPLEELTEYEKELLLIYQTVSNQENYDKMLESVKRLIANENNEIYIHFSRIKSAFCKTISLQYAEYYYISGIKNQAKGILLDKLDTNIYRLQEELFPNDKRFSSFFDDVDWRSNMENALKL